MVRVVLKEVMRRFQDGTRIGPVNLTVEDGKCTCLLGPSGSGKTTILRIVAGLIRPEAGTVEFDGVDVTDLPPAKRRVGMMFQSVALFPNMDVFQNIAFGPTVAGWDRQRVIERVLELSELLGIRNLLHRRAREVSGGEAQRIALARALANEPDLLLLDEPLSSLDPELQIRLRREIRQTQMRLGKTMIYVTHSQDEAFAMADRIAVLNDGVVVQEGTPEDLYENPSSDFVARFVGGGNVLTAEIVSQNDGGTVLRVGEMRFEARGSSHGNDGLAHVSVRPRDVVVRQHGGDGFVAARLLSVDRLTDVLRIEVDYCGNHITAVTDQSLAKFLTGCRSGEPVYIRFRDNGPVILGQTHHTR
ncbi:MAG: ABC transporter ATP-binding protein [Candidatus Thorarchaeota archaeon]